MCFPGYSSEKQVDMSWTPWKFWHENCKLNIDKFSPVDKWNWYFNGLIDVLVGQCGNQIGCRFWDLALREHAAVSKVRWRAAHISMPR